MLTVRPEKGKEILYKITKVSSAMRSIHCKLNIEVPRCMTNSSHLSVFLGLQGSPLLNPLLFRTLLVLLFYLAVQVWRGEAMEKHSILQACHERIHWLTSTSRSTMTNGLAIFRLTYGQQWPFPLLLASIEYTVHIPFVGFSNFATPALQAFASKSKL